MDCLISLQTQQTRTDLPTFYEIMADDLPPFGKKTWKIFILRKNSDILSVGDTE